MGVLVNNMVLCGQKGWCNMTRVSPPVPVWVSVTVGSFLVSLILLKIDYGFWYFLCSAVAGLLATIVSYGVVSSDKSFLVQWLAASFAIAFISVLWNTLFVVIPQII